MSKAKTQGPKIPGNTCFTCQSPEARDILLAGTFNNWDPSANPMERQSDGAWRAELALPPGRYEYKFVVDGVWCCEPGRDDMEIEGCVPNTFGTMNRVIEVTQAETVSPQSQSASQ